MTRAPDGCSRGFFSILLAVLVTAIALGAWIASGSAQAAHCAPFETMTRYLERDFQERDIGGGLIDETLAMRIFAAPAGTSFTVLTLTPDGTACMVITGKGMDLDALPFMEKES
ncbi:MAG: hypothetical protein K8H74_17960 [Notoacmeibacter sp.]|nr:hypothetical protein [Notoacmeibacter sp.]